MSEWEKVYEIGVDAGLCWIGDPCYCVTPDADNHPAPDWSSFCARLREIDDIAAGHASVYPFNYKAGHEGLGCAVSTGYGDGAYPVYIKRDVTGRIAEVKVVFINYEEDKE